MKKLVQAPPDIRIRNADGSGYDITLKQPKGIDWWVQYDDSRTVMILSNSRGYVWEDDEIITHGTLDAFLAKRVFRAEGEELSTSSLVMDANEEDIIKDGVAPRSLLLCKNRVNRKLLESFETEGVIVSSRTAYWLNSKYIKTK